MPIDPSKNILVLLLKHTILFNVLLPRVFSSVFLGWRSSHPTYQSIAYVRTTRLKLFSCMVDVNRLDIHFKLGIGYIWWSHYTLFNTCTFYWARYIDEFVALSRTRPPWFKVLAFISLIETSNIVSICACL
jgi:hypothetical protein